MKLPKQASMQKLWRCKFEPANCMLASGTSHTTASKQLEFEVEPFYLTPTNIYKHGYQVFFSQKVVLSNLPSYFHMSRYLRIKGIGNHSTFLGPPCFHAPPIFFHVPPGASKPEGNFSVVSRLIETTQQGNHLRLSEQCRGLRIHDIGSSLSCQETKTLQYSGQCSEARNQGEERIWWKASSLVGLFLSNLSSYFFVFKPSTGGTCFQSACPIKSALSGALSWSMTFAMYWYDMWHMWYVSTFYCWVCPSNIKCSNPCANSELLRCFPSVLLGFRTSEDTEHTRKPHDVIVEGEWTLLFHWLVMTCTYLY